MGFALLGACHRPACHSLRCGSSYALSNPADVGHPGRTRLGVSVAERLPQPVSEPDPF